MQGIKVGDPALPEYEFGTDPWGSFENHLPAASPAKRPTNESPEHGSAVPVTTAAASSVPEKASPSKPAGQGQPDSAPPESKNTIAENAKTSAGQSNVDSAMPEDVSELTAKCEKLLQRLKTEESSFFPLSEEKIDSWCRGTQQLAEFCRRILRGDGSDDWHRMAIEAGSFAALRELQDKRSAERQERQRREEFLRFLNELPAVICKLELKPISNRRQMMRATDQIAEVKKNIQNRKIEFPEERPLPAGWSGPCDTAEWVRENLLVGSKPLDEDKIKAILPLGQDILEPLFDWYDQLILP